MKKIIWILVLFLGLFMVSAPLMAQELTDSAGITGMDFSTLFTSFAGFCAGVIVLTGLLTKVIQLSALGRSIASWVIALLVSLLGYWLKLGIFNGIDFLQVLGIVVSFAIGSNVIYDVAWIRELLTKFKITQPKTINK